MSITLEERLQRAAELLEQTAVRRATVDGRDRSRRQRPSVASPVWVRAAAVLLVLGAMGGVAWLSARDPSGTGSSASTSGAPQNTVSATSAGATDTTSAGSLAAETTAAAIEVPPAATLPVSSDLASTPITVQASGPTLWYRLRPDLDVAWYSDGQNESQLCFRTPVVEQCQPDRLGSSGFVVVRSAGTQWLVVTLDAVDLLTVRFDDGTQRSVPVLPDSQIGWRVGRIDTGNPIDAAMRFDGTDAQATDTTAAVPTSLATSP